MNHGSMRDLCLRGLAGLALASVMAAAGCAASVHHGQVDLYVATAPPPPPREVIVASPGPGYVWIQGYHTWDGRQYVWRPGRWERRPSSQQHWVDGHWAHDHKKGYYWVEGHWR